MGNICNFFYRKYQLSKIVTNPDIELGQNVKISKSARVEIVNGGKIKIGNNVEILNGVLIQTYGGIIEIGDNCSINAYTIIYGHGNTTIGNNVLMAGHCMVIPNNHNFDDINKNINEQGNSSKGIIIEDNVWIAHGCSILDNVKISKGAIIAAGCVVNKSVETNLIVGGVPRKIIRYRN